MKKILNIILMPIIVTLILCVEFYYNSINALNNKKYGLPPDLSILPEGNHIVSDPNFMENYFFKLNDFGYNLVGTCSYVATSMLMSYYDSYWNDNIIPEQYESSATFSSYTNSIPVNKSAGAISDKNELSNDISYRIANFGNYTYSDYLYFINNKYSNYHHLKLIYEHNILQPWLAGSPDSIIINSNYTPVQTDIEGLNFYQICSLVNSNLSNYGTVKYFTSNVKNQIINLLQNNIPVILGIGSNLGGHVVVAYKYDNSTNKIYVHSGYENLTCVTIEDLNYNSYDFGIYFTPTCNHICSDNYIHNSKRYCVCDLDGTHSHHTHRYNIINERLLNYHNLECICGCESIAYHTIVHGTEYYNTSNARCALCYYCGFELILNVGLTYYTIYI